MTTLSDKDKVLQNLRWYIRLAKLNGMATRTETIAMMVCTAMVLGASCEEVNRAVTDATARQLETLDWAEGEVRE